MRRFALLFFLIGFAISLSAQVLPVDDGILLIKKLSNNPTISKDMTATTEFLEYRLYIPKYDYSKPEKRRIVEVIHQSGGAQVYLYEKKSDSLIKLTGGYIKKSGFEFSYDNDIWGFLCSMCFAQVTVD